MNYLDDVLALKEKHKNTWRDRTEKKWFVGLGEEFLELGLSLLGLHKHPPEVELKQIAAICLNWLEMRHEKKLYKERRNKRRGEMKNV